ncbi:hypothetical protein AALT_g11269 [Alternaria alternata]|nr:hypothetical protein AALT_g11269 [Alternaria alternata]
MARDTRQVDCEGKDDQGERPPHEINEIVFSQPFDDFSSTSSSRQESNQTLWKRTGSTINGAFCQYLPANTMTNALNMLLAISLFRTSLPLAERERFASVSNNTHAPVNAIVFGKVEGDTKAKGSIKARRARKTKRAAKLKWPVKAKITKKTKLTKTTGTTKKTAPHFFSRLPAELRARIWAIAVNDQIEQVSGRWPSDNYTGNTVTIHEHKEVDGEKQLSITSTRGYPTLFAVNREARYEAAKIDGGAWYTLGTDAPEVYDGLQTLAFVPKHTRPQIASISGTRNSGKTVCRISFAERDLNSLSNDRIKQVQPPQKFGGEKMRYIWRLNWAESRLMTAIATW